MRPSTSGSYGMLLRPQNVADEALPSETERLAWKRWVSEQSGDVLAAAEKVVPWAMYVLREAPIVRVMVRGFATHLSGVWLEVSPVNSSMRFQVLFEELERVYT